MIPSSGSLARFSHLSYSIERKAGTSRHPAAYFNIWLAGERRRARGSQALGVDAPSKGGIWSEACNFTLSVCLSRGRRKDFFFLEWGGVNDAVEYSHIVTPGLYALFVFELSRGARDSSLDTVRVLSDSRGSTALHLNRLESRWELAGLIISNYEGKHRSLGWGL